LDALLALQAGAGGECSSLTLTAIPSSNPFSLMLPRHSIATVLVASDEWCYCMVCSRGSPNKGMKLLRCHLGDHFLPLAIEVLGCFHKQVDDFF